MSLLLATLIFEEKKHKMAVNCQKGHKRAQRLLATNPLLWSLLMQRPQR